MTHITRSNDQITIDAQLKSLMNRPNVQSTLILSRKDGTIIRATGFPQNDSTAVLSSQIAHESSLTGADSGSQQAGTNNSGENPVREKSMITPAQRLASAIYGFVSAASQITACMSPTSSSAEEPESEILESRGELSTDQTRSEEEDIQLLRLRTKKQEVIIFPDAKYLCCVVQNVSKISARTGHG